MERVVENPNEEPDTPFHVVLVGTKILFLHIANAYAWNFCSPLCVDNNVCSSIVL
jgi:hypothetical protein